MSASTARSWARVPLQVTQLIGAPPRPHPPAEGQDPSVLAERREHGPAPHAPAPLAARPGHGLPDPGMNSASPMAASVPAPAAPTSPPASPPARSPRRRGPRTPQAPPARPPTGNSGPAAPTRSPTRSASPATAPVPQLHPRLVRLLRTSQSSSIASRAVIAQSTHRLLWSSDPAAGRRYGDQPLDAQRRLLPLRARPLPLQPPPPVGSHATATAAYPFARACPTAESSASPSRNAFARTIFYASTGTS